MKSVLVIFIIGAVSAAFAHNHRGKYEFEEANWRKSPKSFPWNPSQDLEDSSEQLVNSWNSPNEDLYQDQSGSSENLDSPRIPWDLPRWGAPRFQEPQIFPGQNRMDWSSFFVPASHRAAKHSHLDQERMKKIMAELEDVAEKIYETFEILKNAAAENSQEEIDNIVSDALEETLNGMNDAKDYAVETGGEKYKQCIKDLEDDLHRVVEDTKEIPKPECSLSDSNEVVDSFEEKISQFNETINKITEINEKINDNIKNCPFRNSRPCHRGLLSLENSARHAIREGHHQIQMMEKAIDMQGVETDQCRDTYLESLITQENEYNNLLEQCSAENSYENEEYNEITFEGDDYYSGNQEEEDQYNDEAADDYKENKEEFKEDDEDINEGEKVNEEKINEDEAENEEATNEDEDEENNEEENEEVNEYFNEENNAEEKLEEETEHTTPLAKN